MAKNIVMLFDGTGNEPGLSGNTNVLRLFDWLARSDEQVVWYDAGVGTEGSGKAMTTMGRWTSKVAGQAFGYGMKDNVVDAYRFLIHSWDEGDRLFVLGFSRGAYSARALCGFLFQIGLLRPEHENLIPYALKRFWWNVKTEADIDTWRGADVFSRQFARSTFRRRRTKSVHFVGLWDTVNASGYARPELDLPWTSSMPMARKVWHAVSIDEKRRPFDPTLLDEDAVKERSGDLHEVWFSGVHSDVGGTFTDDHGFADITLRWMIDAAIEESLNLAARVDPSFGRLETLTLGKIHDMGKKWAITELFHHRDIVPNNARVHESVFVRRDHLDYEPRLPEGHSVEPWPRVE